MGRSEMRLGASGLRSIGAIGGEKPRVRLGTVCISGPTIARGRGVDIDLSEQDIDWLLSNLAANELWAAKMKAAVVARDSLLTEAEGGSPMRKVGITNRLSNHLLEVLRNDDH